MGRLIDEYEAIKTQQECVSKTIDTLWKMAQKYQQLKADYENRLKADMVAMLEELKKEIIELPFPQREPEYMQGYSYCQMNILDDVIQEKIDKLRGDENE